MNMQANAYVGRRLRQSSMPGQYASVMRLPTYRIMTILLQLSTPPNMQNKDKPQFRKPVTTQKTLM